MNASNSLISTGSKESLEALNCIFKERAKLKYFFLPGEFDAMFAKQRIKDETQQKLSPILTLFKKQYQELKLLYL